MHKIVIIGGGFAGLAAAARLSLFDSLCEVTLFDKKDGFDFLPSLPDAIGRGINPRFLTSNIRGIADKKGFKFINDEVVSVDLGYKAVATAKENFKYDYLLIASGSETNFYGNEDIKRKAFQLDSAEDAGKIIKELKSKIFDSYIISGGGYTGVEVAANLWLFLNKNKIKSKIIILERASSILGPLPEWMKQYALDNLAKMGIEIFLNTAIERIESSNVHVTGGKIFNNSFVVWSAGVKTPGFIQNLKISKNTQGRIEVDEHLKLNDSCFVAGDTAYFKYNNIYLRMAVQFAIIQGDLAAKNIIRSIKGTKLIKYKPVDLGYIIPMANNKSCGKVFGLNVTGLLATMFHFVMCVYRLHGVKNKIGFIKGLLRM